MVFNGLNATLLACAGTWTAAPLPKRCATSTELVSTTASSEQIGTLASKKVASTAEARRVVRSVVLVLKGHSEMFQKCVKRFVANVAN